MRDRAIPLLPGFATRLIRVAVVLLLLLGSLGTGRAGDFAAPQVAHLLDHAPAARALPVQAALLRAAEVAAPEPAAAPPAPVRAASAADIDERPARRAAPQDAAPGPFHRSDPRPASQGPPLRA